MRRSPPTFVLLLGAVVLLDAGCRRPPQRVADLGAGRAEAGTDAPALARDGAPPAWSPRPEPARLVAIGDVHGDLVAARKALKIAGAIDDRDRWIGKKLVVVQVGDQLDRGDEDREVFDLFQRLADEAQRSGGAVLSLLGNHETMNAEGSMSYVTPGGWPSFVGVDGIDRDAYWLATYPEAERPRRAALAPGGPYARLLATRHVVVQVGATLFAHASVTRRHVEYGLTRINEQTRQWLLGEIGERPFGDGLEYGPDWSYAYSGTGITPETCASLREVLLAVSAERMVVGHVVQPYGITSECDGRVWHIDVGMSRFYHGNRVQALDLTGGAPTVLQAP